MSDCGSVGDGQESMTGDAKGERACRERPDVMSVALVVMLQGERSTVHSGRLGCQGCLKCLEDVFRSHG